MSTPYTADIFLVQRGTTQYQVLFDRLGDVADADLLLVQRGATQHRVSGADLKAYLAGAEPPPPPPPEPELWTPADAPGLTMWFDPSFASSVTVVDGGVSQIVSRGVTGVVATQANVALQPKSAAGILEPQISGGVWRMGLNAEIQARALYSVVAHGVITAGEPISIVRSSSVDTIWRAPQIPRLDMFHHNFSHIQQGGGAGSLSMDGDPMGAWSVRRTQAFWRGTLRVQGAETTLNSLVDRLGDQVDGQGSCIQLREVVAYSAALSTDDHLRLTGYLAHSAGIASTLIPGHPYKNAPPLRS